MLLAAGLEGPQSSELFHERVDRVHMSAEDTAYTLVEQERLKSLINLQPHKYLLYCTASDADKKVESALQRWTTPREFRLWWPLSYVCAACPGVTEDEILAYCKLGRNPHLTTIRSARERGLDWRSHGRVSAKKVSHLFILRRDQNEESTSVIDFERQMTAEQIYTATYHTAGLRQDFHTSMFHVTETTGHAGFYTLAESVYGITEADPLAKKVCLEEYIEKLEDLRVPPYLHPAMEVDDKDDPSPSRTTRASNVPPSELAAMDDSDDAYPDRPNLLEVVRGWEVRTITSPLTFLETLIQDKRTFLIQTRHAIDVTHSSFHEKKIRRYF